MLPGGLPRGREDDECKLRAEAVDAVTDGTAKTDVDVRVTDVDVNVAVAAPLVLVVVVVVVVTSSALATVKVGLLPLERFANDGNIFKLFKNDDSLTGSTPGLPLFFRKTISHWHNLIAASSTTTLSGRRSSFPSTYTL